MIRPVLLLSLLLSLLNASGQEIISKQVDIYDAGGNSLTSFKTYYGDSLVSDYVIFLGRNRQYTHIVDMFVIKKLPAAELLSFFDYAIKFYENDKGTSTLKDNVLVSVEEMYGVKYIQFSVDGKYNTYPLKHLTKLRNALQEWINKQSI